MGATCELTADGLTVTGTGPDQRHHRRPARRSASSRPVLDRGRRAGRLAVGVHRHRAYARARDRPAGRAGHARSTRWAARSTELADGLEIRPRPLRRRAPFDSYDDHRMVMAAAVLGLAVPGVRVQNAATVAKTFPGFTRLWAAMLGSGQSAARSGASVLTRRPSQPAWTRTTSGSGRAAAPGRAPAAGPRTRTPPRRSWPPSTGAGTAAWSATGEVTAMKARELGRAQRGRRRPGALVGDLSGAPGTLARIVRVAAAHVGAAPFGRRHRPGRAGDRRQRRPAGDRHRAGRPPPRLRLIDRCLVAAYDAGLDPLLCLTKADLAPPDERARRLRAARPAATW